MPRSLPFARYERRGDGYCRWRTSVGGEERYVYEHRLLATLLPEVEELDDLEGRDVHHRLHVRELNVLGLEADIPELDEEPLLEIVESEEHRREHLRLYNSGDGDVLLID